MFERCKYANDCNAQCSGAIENSETCDSFQLHQKLEQAVNQYNQVVKQNKDLQTELNNYKRALEEIRTACQYYIFDERDLTPEQIIAMINEVLNG